MEVLLPHVLGFTLFSLILFYLAKDDIQLKHECLIVATGWQSGFIVGESLCSFYCLTTDIPDSTGVAIVMPALSSYTGLVFEGSLGFSLSAEGGKCQARYRKGTRGVVR